MRNVFIKVLINKLFERRPKYDIDQMLTWIRLCDKEFCIETFNLRALNYYNMLNCYLHAVRLTDASRARNPDVL